MQSHKCYLIDKYWIVCDTMDTKLMRIGVSLPDNLLDEFDEIIEKKGYICRSEAIRDAINSYISYYEWMCDIKGRHIGAIAVIYDHNKRGLADALTDIQHKYSYLVKSSVHIYLDHSDCYEIVVLDGEGEEIAALNEAMMKLKGVKFSNITTVAQKKDMTINSR
ncbi:MAG: CopG family transcriptional regulator, nickel-responsive regulator [Euryarchaeota archaeon]|nr:CopG family transcriptional regulator, nickel-responsive regulator [Euryarchaeota archaeon]